MILKLTKHNEKREIDFELKYLSSLSTRERFKLMAKKTKEIVSLLERYGHREAFKIIKRK